MNPTPALRRMLVVLLGVSLFFSAVFGFTLTMNVARLSPDFILDNPVLEAERERVASGADPALFRELHLLVRRAWFIRAEDLRWGRFFLIVSLALFFFSWQSLMIFYGRSRRPGCGPSFLSVPGEEGPRPPERPRDERPLPFRKRVMYSGLAAVILAGGAGVISSFLAEAQFPGLAGGQATPPEAKDAMAKGAVTNEDTTCPCTRIRALGIQYHSVLEDSKGNFSGLRGAAGTGRRDEGEPPSAWDLKTGEGILWNVSLPGKGRGSPVVWDDRVFLTAEESGNGVILCVSLKDGSLLWRFGLEKAGVAALPPADPQAGLCAPTPAVDSGGVYAAFSGGIVVAVSHTGEFLWKHDPGSLNIDFGYASSPRAYQGKVYVQYDHDGESRVEALSAADGTKAWTSERPSGFSWSSPVLVDTGKEVLLVTQGSEKVTVTDPAFGETLWDNSFLSGEIAPLPAYDDGTLFVVSPGYTVKAVSLYKGQALWEYDALTPDVASPLASGGLVYIPTSFGVLHCVDVATGTLRWELNREVGWYASPLLIGNSLYLFDRAGDCEIVRVDGDGEAPRQTVLSVGDPVDATPAWTGTTLIVRTERRLIAIGGEK